MQLSGAGESLQVYAERWLALEDEARQVLSGGRDGGSLRIGSALLPASVLALAAPPAELKTLPAGSADTLLVWRSGYDLPAFRRLRECLDEGRG